MDLSSGLFQLQLRRAFISFFIIYTAQMGFLGRHVHTHLHSFDFRKSDTAF